MPGEASLRSVGIAPETVDGDIAASSKESRKFERIELIVPGKVFDPSTAREFDCQVTNMSPGGAGLVCAECFASDVALVLYMDSFGRFEGRVVTHQGRERSAERTFGLRFNLPPAKQQRVTNMLASFVEGGLQAVTSMRAARRVRTNGIVIVSLSEGSTLECELIDISLDGVAVRTLARPPVGISVRLGETIAEVVRHHETGIAMRFLRPGPVVSGGERE